MPIVQQRRVMILLEADATRDGDKNDVVQVEVRGLGIAHQKRVMNRFPKIDASFQRTRFNARGR